MQHLTKFNLGELQVKEYPDWIVAVRGKQITPGSMVVLPKSELVSFGDMSPAQSAGLVSVLAELERATLSKEGLAADKFNIVAAMMKDPIIHFHFIPRYKNEVILCSRPWVDQDWPALIQFRDVSTDSTTLECIRQRLIVLLSR